MTLRRSLPRHGWILSVFIVLAGAIAAWPYTVDDAFILARYAVRLASGLGYTFDGTEPTDGVTGPLWLLPLVLSRWAGLEVVVSAKVLGLASTFAAVAVATRSVTRRALGSKGALWFLLASFASCSTLAIWSVAGLETGLATLLFTLACDAVCRVSAPRLLSGGACLGALAWVRPELALACAVVYAASLARAVPRGRAFVTRATLPAVTLVAGVLLFRGALFGHWLPMSLAAKPALLENGVAYLWRTSLITASCTTPWLLCVVLLRGRDRADRWLAAALLAHDAALVLAGGDWMPGARLVAPTLPMTFALTARVLARTWTRARGRILVRAAVLGTALLALAAPCLDYVQEISGARDAGGRREREGRMLVDSLRGVRSVALVDIGFVGYETRAAVVDLGGLTDPRIAYLRGGHLDKRVSEALLRGESPRAIVLHSATRPIVGSDGRLRAFSGYPVEHRVARMPWVQSHFRVAGVLLYAPGYYYILLEAFERQPNPLDP